MNSGPKQPSIMILGWTDISVCSLKGGIAVVRYIMATSRGVAIWMTGERRTGGCRVLSVRFILEGVGGEREGSKKRLVHEV
jgi:hypothetical protein